MSISTSLRTKEYIAELDINHQIELELDIDESITSLIVMLEKLNKVPMIAFLIGPLLEQLKTDQEYLQSIVIVVTQQP